MLQGKRASIVEDEMPIALLLDVNLGDKEAYSVAERLAARGIPFTFSTGCGVGGVADRWRVRPTAPKPFNAADLRGALEAALAGS